MSDHETGDYDIKQCGRCAAWIPRSATMCSYCGSTSPDSRIDPRPSRTPLGLPPWVTVTRVLIAVNCLYFLFSMWAQIRRYPDTPVGPLLIEGRGFSQMLLVTGSYRADRVAGGEWWRILSATFLHGGLVHLAVNMFSLARLGHFCEELLGGAKTLAIYVVCAVASTVGTGLWFTYVERLDGAHAPQLVGASGAICGLAGLLAAFLLKNGTESGRRIGWSILQSVGMMLLLGWIIPFVSNTAHVAGLIPGVLVGLVVRERFSTLVSPQARRNWWLLATIGAVAAGAALARGFLFTTTVLGGSR